MEKVLVYLISCFTEYFDETCIVTAPEGLTVEATIKWHIQRLFRLLRGACEKVNAEHAKVVRLHKQVARIKKEAKGLQEALNVASFTLELERAGNKRSRACTRFLEQVYSAPQCWSFVLGYQWPSFVACLNIDIRDAYHNCQDLFPDISLTQFYKGVVYWRNMGADKATSVSIVLAKPIDCSKEQA